MVPVRLLLIPVLITLNYIVLPFQMLGYAGSGLILYTLYLFMPPEVINLFYDLSTLPSRLSSLVDTSLWRLLVWPFHYLLELLRPIPLIGRMVEPIAPEEELTFQRRKILKVA